MLGCVCMGTASVLREGLPLLYLPLRLRLGPGLGPQFKKITEKLELTEGTKTFGSLEHLSCEEGLREFNLCSLEQRGASGDLRGATQWQWGGYQEGKYLVKCVAGKEESVIIN